jgi:serine/threonine protein kinase
MIDKYRVEETLRSGYQGDTLVGQCTQTGDKVLIRSYLKQRLVENPHLSRSKMQELVAHQAVNHPNVIKLVETLQDNLKYYLVFEHASEGPVSEIIKKKGCLKEHLVYSMLLQLLEGVAALHKSGLIHRNLSTKRVYMKDNCLKIGGLDSSVFLNKTTEKNLCTGNPLNLAPELITSGLCSTKCDVWSLGVIVYEMIYGTPPVTGNNLKELTESYSKLQLVAFSTYSRVPTEYLLGLVKKMLETEPNKRISFEELYAQKPTIQAMLDKHSLIGLHVNCNSIEYYYDPVFFFLESTKAKKALLPLQDLVDQTHQINSGFKTDPNINLKRLRLELLFCIHCLLFTIDSFKQYKRKLPTQLLLSMIDGTTAKLSEYERGLAKYTGGIDQIQKILAQLSNEKVSLNNLRHLTQEGSPVNTKQMDFKSGLHGYTPITKSA